MSRRPDDEIIATLRAAGATDAAIGAAIGRSENAVRHRRARMGLTTPASSPASRRRITRLLSEGMSPREIAPLVGLTPGSAATICSALRQQLRADVANAVRAAACRPYGPDTPRRTVRAPCAFLVVAMSTPDLAPRAGRPAPWPTSDDWYEAGVLDGIVGR